jgi:parallel beta-helix repeat protein
MKSIIGIIIISFLFTNLIPITSSLKISSNKIIYVDDDNINGPWDGTMEHPYQFIHDGIKQATDGDIVFVHSGNYIDYLWIDQPINLIGEDRNTTIINRYSENLIVIYVTSSNVTINGFTIRKYPDYGIMTNNVNSVRISENNICECDTGIFLYNSYNTLIMKNNINLNKFTGINTYNSYSTHITGNNISDNSEGINQEKSSSVIENNLISNNSYGIRFKDCSNSYIDNNTIISNYHRGIDIVNISKSEIKNNLITDNGATFRYNPSRMQHGFYLSHSSNCVIYKNIIDYNDRGITIYYSDNNTIRKNNILNNPRTGVYLSNSVNNKIYLNNFINNNIQAYDNFQNSWDYKKIGNYWDDFEEKYPNANRKLRGVWDTPYEISNDNIDRYPLVEPFKHVKSYVTTNNNIIYVDDDGSADYKSIQDAIDNASDGYTIYVFEGIYYENGISINITINLIGEDKDTTIIDASQEIDGILIYASYVNISGFKIQNVSRAGINLASNTSDNVNISNNIFYNNAHGIHPYFNHRNLIISNNIFLNNVNGFTLVGCSYASIYQNQFINNSYWGIGLFMSSHCNIFHNNITYGKKFGIHLYGLSHSNYIHHNNFIKNHINAYFVQLSHRNKWDYNYWNEPKTRPYIIFGSLGLLIPLWINIDWHPALKPYDITI